MSCEICFDLAIVSQNSCSGNESTAVVEFAPFQKVPSSTKKLDTRIATIDKGSTRLSILSSTEPVVSDEDFISFLESLKEPETTAVDVDTLELLGNISLCVLLLRLMYVQLQTRNLLLSPKRHRCWRPSRRRSTLRKRGRTCCAYNNAFRHTTKFTNGTLPLPWQAANHVVARKTMPTRRSRQLLNRQGSQPISLRANARRRRLHRLLKHSSSRATSRKRAHRPRLTHKLLVLMRK